MWTPKRFVLLAGGVAVFLTAYFGYALSVLGGIDGLPPLPDVYWPGDGKLVDFPAVAPRSNRLVDKIREAFGSECQEQTRPLKLEVHSRNILIAADGKVLEDGRIMLAPMSLALYGKDKAVAKVPEINTIRASVGYLTFDQPIGNPSEVAGRKLVSAELSGNIEIVNNRRTLERDDDLCLFIKKGPLFYDEKSHRIWTEDDIHLTDNSSKPKPIEVYGQGMQLDLLVESTPPQPGPTGRKSGKGKHEQIAGVKQINLLANVDMHLYVDSKSGFPGAGQAGPARAPAKTGPGKKAVPAELPPEKAHVTIKTPGRFEYEIFKDHDEARFDVPKGTTNAGSPQDVTVMRHHEQLGLIDQLVCQHLDLRIHRKEKKDDKAAPADVSPEQGVEIETAHATGQQVTLTSDEQKLVAEGNELFYDARKLTTVLKGEPRMKAVKDGNTILARELHIQDQKLPTQPGMPVRSFQQATAFGPVNIELIDKANGALRPIRAACTDRLISTKDGPHDLLILTGTASFTDEEHNQHLQADTLRVWLNPEEREPAGKAVVKATPADGPPIGGRRPHHIEALKNVIAWAPEMNIHDTSRLVVWFKDVHPSMLPDDKPAREGQLIETRKTIAPSPVDQSDTARPITTNVGVAPRPSPRAPRPAPVRPDDGKKTPPRPIDLKARVVEAWVLRSGPKSQLEKLWTEGKVEVHQDPAKPDEKGVDVRGDTLEMIYHPEGNFLVVSGGDGGLAELRLDKIYITGPEVNIDQAANTAWVNGIGAMVMDSDTNFQGEKIGRTVPLEIHWNTSMFFNGRRAEFHGGTTAEQENARLAGQSLTVFFDRPISLKEGNKTDQQPKVEHLVCDKDVHVEEAAFEGRKLVRYQRLQTPALAMTALEREDDDPRAKASGNPGNEVNAAGPGNLRIFRYGDDPAMTPNGTARPGERRGDGTTNKPPADKQPKVTYVQFGKKMHANSKKNTATFYENVRVLHMPSDDPNVEIDLDVMSSRLPKGAMYLSCDQLEVYNRGEKGRGQQEMLARGRCLVQSDKFWGRGQTVTYNEAKDQIILKGTDDEPAVVWKVERPGADPEPTRALQIIYSRKTETFSVDRIESIDGH